MAWTFAHLRLFFFAIYVCGTQLDVDATVNHAMTISSCEVSHELPLSIREEHVLKVSAYNFIHVSSDFWTVCSEKEQAALENKEENLT